MATRINIRFIVGLGVVLGALVVGMAGFYYAFVQKDPAELIERGDALMAEGEAERALGYYGPALRQQRTNLALIDKYIDALRAAPVDDTLAAQERLGQIREWTRRATELRPDDVQRLERLYALERHIATRIGGGGAYDRLHELTATRLEARPGHPVASKYHGIAQMHRLTADMPREDREGVRATLVTAHRHFEDDPTVLHYLARWHAREAEHARRNNEDERAAALREEALALSRAMLADDPDDLDRQIKHLRLLSEPAVEAGEEARSLLGALTERLREDPVPREAVLTLAELLPELMPEPIESADAAVDGGREAGVDTDAAAGMPPMTRGRREARGLLEAAVDAAPADAVLLARLGRLRTLAGEHDAAIEAFEAVREHSQVAPPLDYLHQRELRLRSTVQLADLLMGRADRTETADARELILRRVSGLIEEIEQSPGGAHAPLSMLRGKLALLRDRHDAAAMHLDRAIEQSERVQPALLVLSSKAHQRLGNWGAAAERLERLLEARPEMSQVRIELATMLLDGGQLREATEHVHALLRQHPGHARTRQLQVRLLLQQGQLESAVGSYYALDSADRGALLRRLVQAHMSAGREAEALALIEHRLEEAPSDLRAIHLMIRLAPETVEQRGLLAEAESRGANAMAIELLEHQLEAQLDGSEAASEAWVASLLEQQSDPLRQALLEAQLARRRGDAETLREAIDRAASADPQDEDVVALRFELALQDQRWDEAERLANAAADRNLDQAQGAFFKGRLAAGRGELATATAHYRRGLSARPVHAEGWRRFGDVLLRRDDAEGARDAYRRALEQQPDNVAAYRGLAAALDQRGEHEASLEQLRSAVRYAPADRALIEQYARYERRFGDPARVVAVRRQLARLQPENVTNRRALALLLAQVGEAEEARRVAAALIESHGRSRANVSVLAAAHRDSGDPAGGERVLRAYLAELGEDAAAEDYVLLAHYRLSLGDGAGALAAYRVAMGREDLEHRPVTRELADLLLTRGMYRPAAALYQTLHEHEPEDNALALRLGEALVRDGQLEEAERVLEKLDQAGPTLALYGLLAGERGRIERGVALLTEALKREHAEGPGSMASIYFERGRLHAAAGRYEPALEDLEAALEHNAGLLAAHELRGRVRAQTGDMQGAITSYRALLAQAPADHAARLRLAELHVRENEPEQATRVLRAGAERFPRDPTWPRSLAHLAMRRGDVDAAAEHYHRALELEPRATELLRLTSLQLDAGQAEAALALLREHMALVRDHAPLEARRGRALAALAEPEQARSVFERVLAMGADVEQTTDVARQMAQALGTAAALSRLEAAIEAEDGRAEAAPDEGADTQRTLWLHLAAAEMELRQEAAEAAISRLEGQRARLDAANEAVRWQFHRLLAQAHQQRGAPERAAQAYERMLELRPEHLATLNDFAYLLVDALDEPRRALPLAQRAAELAPNNARVLDTLGWTQHQLGQIEAARQTLERALSLDAPPAEAHLHLGMVYAQLDRPRAAREQLEAAARLAEENENDAVRAEATRRLERMSR